MIHIIKYVIRKAEENQERLRLSGTHQLLVYTDDIGLLGGNMNTTAEHTEALRHR
jgi:hypothetical protein